MGRVQKWWISPVEGIIEIPRNEHHEDFFERVRDPYEWPPDSAEAMDLDGWVAITRDKPGVFRVAGTRKGMDINKEDIVLLAARNGIKALVLEVSDLNTVIDVGLEDFIDRGIFNVAHRAKMITCPSAHVPLVHVRRYKRR